MGADTGGGDASPQSESGRGTSPQKSRYLQICLKELTKVSRSFKTFKIKWPKFEEKSEFGVGGFDGPESVPPPQSKLRGGATVSIQNDIAFPYISHS